MSELLKALSAPFPASEVRQRSDGRGGKLDYVGWDSVVRRLNEVVDIEWDLDINESSVAITDQTTKGGKPLWLAQVQVSLTVWLDVKEHLFSRRGGVGAALMADPDDALKTAQAEALKKASNQFGMALELWTEEGREVVARGRAVAGGDLSVLKQEVFQLALAQGAEPNADSVAETLGIDVSDLQDAEKLRKIVELV
jgi:LysM repeat protein